MNREEMIMKRVQEHYDYLDNLGYEIVGIFLQGSQNYNNDIYDNDYKSDIDTKAIVLPKFEDFVACKQAISTTLVLENNEHIDVKDIRVMFDTLKKSNVNFLEILFTDFKIINIKYKDLMKEIFDNAEKLAFADKKQLLNCIVGMSKQKYCALKHPYPTIKDKIEKFGYDPKQLTHIIRMNYFIKRIISGESFKSALNELENKEYLTKVKKGFYDLETAEELADKFDIETYYLKEKEFLEKEFIIDLSAQSLYNETKYKILKKWFKEELLGE